MPRSTVARGTGLPRPSRGEVAILTELEQRDWRVARRRAGSRAISPEAGVSEVRRERAEVATVAKMLVVGLLVLAIILAGAWWLNVRMG